VIGYKLYYETAPKPVSYDSPFVTLSGTSIKLSSVVSRIDGVYNFGVTAVDGSGNESDFSLKSDVRLDFTPPAAPGQLSILIGFLRGLFR